MRIALILLLLGSTAAGAAELTAEHRQTSIEPERYGHFGVSLDAGLPYGAGASMLYRPFPMLRFQAGAVHNGMAAGGRFAAAFVPFQTFIRPTLTIEGGFLPSGDGPLLRQWFGNRPELDALSALSYRFGTAKLGLELGSSKRFSFHLQGGLSFIDGGITDYQGDGFFFEGMDVQLVIPSASLGFSLFFG